MARITDWILSLGGWFALAIVFLVPALEASVFLGFLFPGEIAVILGGVLAFNGRVPLPSVIAAAVTGAIVGDSIGYFVGRRWGRQILRGVGRRVPFLRHRIDEHLETAQAYLRRRRGTAVFFGRFTAALRVMVPGLAGMAELPYGQFLFYNAAGGLLWGTGFVLLGYFAGEAWPRVAGGASKVGLGLLVLLLIGLIVVRILRGVRERGERVTDNAVLIPLVVALGGYMLLRRKEWRAAALLVAALVGANAFYQVTKPLVARARPPEPLHLVGVSGYSFPSGHATASIAVWGAVALVLTAGRARRLKVAIWIGAGLVAALVAFSRVYLGAHWWTDVVGGLGIGGAWLCVLVAITLTGRGKVAASEQPPAAFDRVVKA